MGVSLFMGLIPVVGSLKYTDEVGTLVKQGLKGADEAGEAAVTAAKTAPKQVYEWPAGYKPSPLMTDDEAKEFVARGWFPKSVKPSPIATDDEIKQLLELEKREGLPKALSNTVEEVGTKEIDAAGKMGYNGSKGLAEGAEDDDLFRGDDLLYEEKRPNGISKSHLNSVGDLVPANVDGLYKDRQVTVTEHILGGYRKGAKGNSPYTSFTNDKGIVANYGNSIIKVDLDGLIRDVNAGKVRGVEVLTPGQVQDLIKSDVQESEYWRELALKWAKRDKEHLIKGIIPQKYISIITNGGI